MYARRVATTRSRPARPFILNCPRRRVPKLYNLEESAMTEEKPKEPEEQTPAHSTEEERERLKDFNKDGIPPGAC